jgi:hypothetical protein
MTKRYLTDRQVCQRYNVHTTTLFRWDRNPQVGFPKPIRINGRKYRDEAALDDFDREHRAVVVEKATS